MSLFSQNLEEFKTSKTNWNGISLIVLGITGLMTGDFSTMDAMTTILFGVGFLSVKDAIHKIWNEK